ncbi:uncharacterized protein [Antedon mediterranea]|uniref:uncharacterized protein n=1 Tax=Antedon mediterranea TaxID=105859 RepID=UPI003AF56A01
MTSVGSDKATNNIRSLDNFLGKSSSVHHDEQTTMGSKSNEGYFDKGKIQQEEPSRSRPDSPTTAYVTQRLEDTIRPEIKRKIDEIVASTRKFNDLEKLLLYLKLPTGSSLCTKPNKDKSSSQVLSSRPTHWRGLNWIRTHLEESVETSLSKQDIYDDYRNFCEMSNYQILSAADFGKHVKQVFPNIKVRRLGTRGNSKYCYSGINKKTEVRPPSLPNLDLIRTKKSVHGSILGADQQINDSANIVVCEWASKRIGCAITSVVDLAKHLVSTNNVQGKSAAAFNLLVEHPSKQLLHRVRTGALTHKETNLHLQRTIQRRQMHKQKQQSEANKQSSCTSTTVPKQVDSSKTVESVEMVYSDYQLKIDSDSGHSRGSDSSFSGSDVATDHDNLLSSPKKFCSSTANNQNNISHKESPNTRKLKPLMPKTPISESQQRGGQVICLMSSPMAGSQMTGTQPRQCTTPVTPVTPVLQVNDQTYLLITPSTSAAILQDPKSSGTPAIDSIKKAPTIVATNSISTNSPQRVVTTKSNCQTGIVGGSCSTMPNASTISIGKRSLRVLSLPVQSSNMHNVVLNNTTSKLTSNISTPESTPMTSTPMMSRVPKKITSGPIPVSISVAGGSVNENQVKLQSRSISVNELHISSDNKSLKPETQALNVSDNSSSASLLKLIGLQKEDQSTRLCVKTTNKPDSSTGSILQDMLVLRSDGNIHDWQNTCSSPSIQVLNSTIPRASSANANSLTLINTSQVPTNNIGTIYNIHNNTLPVVAQSGSTSVPSSPGYISQPHTPTHGQHYVIQTISSPGPSESGNVFSFTPIANTGFQNGLPISPKPMPKPKPTMGVKLDLSEKNSQLVMCQDSPRQVPKTARQELNALRGGQSNIRPVRNRRVSASSRKKMNQPYVSKTTIGAGVLTSPGNSRSATPVSCMLTNASNIQLYQSESESMPPPSPNPLKVEVSPCVAHASSLLNNRSIDQAAWRRQRRLSGPPTQFSLTNVGPQLLNADATISLTIRQSQRSQSVPLPELGFDALLPKYQAMWSAKESLTPLPSHLQEISISEEDFLGTDEQAGDLSVTTSVSADDNSMMEPSWDLDREDTVLTNSNAANTMFTSTLNCGSNVTDDVMTNSLTQDNILQQISTTSSFSGSENSIDMDTDSFDASWSLGHLSSLPCGS